MNLFQDNDMKVLPDLVFPDLPKTFFDLAAFVFISVCCFVMLCLLYRKWREALLAFACESSI